MAGWGDEVWKDDDKVRVLHGQHVEPWKTFDECSGSWRFPAGLMQFLKDAGFRCPTPIQAYTWPVLMEGKDVIGVAKTGSGKTLGYLLPGYIKVKRNEGKSFDPSRGPGMLIMAPTRELCQQIFEESERFGKPAKIDTACVYGGAPKGQQVRQLRNSPHCVVATPGRLNDFLSNRELQINQCEYLVLDEADRMLDMGFEPQIRELINYLPGQRQTALYTATWPREVKEIASRLTQDAAHIQVGSEDSASANADITQHIVRVVNEKDKMRFLEGTIFPELQRTGGSGLIFVKTKKAASGLYRLLECTQRFGAASASKPSSPYCTLACNCPDELSRVGAPIVCLHGDMDRSVQLSLVTERPMPAEHIREDQSGRDHALHAFKTGMAKVFVLVATDVAQRGLDIKNVAFVVNYDAPSNLEDYVHRIGRTGRAGEKGDAYTCLYDSDSGIANQIKKVFQKTGQQIPRDLVEIASGGGGIAQGWGRGGGGGGGGGPVLNGQWGGKYAQNGGGGGYGGGGGGW
ncbi:RH14 [Symbiodinium sp. CCMP2592]|nr:RH14 [Symbiodinium sp. CCMP2592]